MWPHLDVQMIGKRSIEPLKSLHWGQTEGKDRIHTQEGHSVAAKNGLVRSHWVGKEGCRIQPEAEEEDMQVDLDMDRDTAVPLEAVVVHMEPHWVAAEGDGSFQVSVKTPCY